MVEVRVTAGTVRGAVESGSAVFRGIPFAAPPVGEHRFAAPHPVAAPPVGEHRFAAPHPVAAWTGVREALAFGPPPPQPSVFGMDRPAGAGDDWLTVLSALSRSGNTSRPTTLYASGRRFDEERIRCPRQHRVQRLPAQR
ncbi:carboxylesterase family protein [Lentzea sp. E54]|uniref:carboxylesterase family protein n=1 Tax=Lentzea xerophila TaxID=3435883 RepID=UPI003DA4F6CD